MSEDEMSRLSFIIPARDEEGTVETLSSHILETVRQLGEGYAAEIILVDDGSRDRTWEVMKRLAEQSDGCVCAIKLRRNFGKAVALETGFRRATGDVVFTMDADLQDDPSEIPRFLKMLEDGHDLVSGWKRRRRDPVSKTLPSRVFNWATAFATGVNLHDFNCGFKAYRREVVESLRLYGELHRYIPVLAHDAGFRVGEIEVQHHPRRYGRSKYGWERYARGLLDLFTVLATTRWLQKPGHLFGGIGLTAGMTGAVILSYLALLWFLGMGPIGNRPLFFLGILLCILSVQMVSLGLLAELLIRINNPRDVTQLIAEELPSSRSRPRVEESSKEESGGCVE